MSGNILFLGNKIFEIPPFFQTRPGDLGKQVHACSLRFSALKLSSILDRRVTSFPGFFPKVSLSLSRSVGQVGENPGNDGLATALKMYILCWDYTTGLLS